MTGDSNCNDGVIETTLEEEMEYFDSLPPALRQALANADRDYESGQVWEAYFIMQESVSEIVQDIKNTDSKRANEQIRNY